MTTLHAHIDRDDDEDHRIGLTVLTPEGKERPLVSLSLEAAGGLLRQLVDVVLELGEVTPSRREERERWRERQQKRPKRTPKAKEPKP